jgi:transcriptional antiterminator RfaH
MSTDETAGTKRWYLVYCKPRQERIAVENLERQGYETYLPRVRETRRRAGQRIQVIAPLFPRYLFIHLDQEFDNWGPIRSTLGVVSLVRFGQLPARVPDELLALLHGREDAEGLQTIELQALKTGARVRVASGSLAGYEGIFLAKTARERVVVLLDILGKATRTQMDALDIEPVTRG